MDDSWVETWTMNPFAGLLTDAIVFDGFAHTTEIEDFPAVNRYAKAAVTNAVLAIEAGANSCLARMTYPEIVVKQLDKLPVVDKYDVLYVSMLGKKLDRGCRHFQAIKELFQLRNQYVHPKIKKVEMKIKSSGNGRKTYQKDMEYKKTSPVLKIPYDFSTWTGEHSRSVVKATISFLNYFFVELCGLNSEKSSELLSVFVKGPVNTATLLSASERDVLHRVKGHYGLEVKFLVFEE